ncbi:hypothetical protein G7007_10940 [Pseudomonas entomophila]|uniref:hypothetical protein n=1 Tax=Pseudomonas entomophila TaxID=312306 RepID=UPI0015E3D6E6|nr:hypothetical protein [Pseudomonas entomophila]MBA1193375.1 hypothetical protein [Pseudomonas entomophila]
MFRDFTHFAYQLAFFTEKCSIPADEFSVDCRKKLSIGSTNPTFIPDFPGLADEVPRLQIQSDVGYTVTLSNVRVDIIVDLPFGLNEAERNRFLSNAKILAEILGGHEFKFSRIGLVKRYLKTMDNPGQFISQHFGGHGGPRVYDFSVNAVAETDLLGQRCNNVFNFSAATIRGTEKGVVAYRDLNTVTGQKDLSLDSVLEFIVAAEVELSIESLARFVES